jgi:hypothetical protein
MSKLNYMMLEKLKSHGFYRGKLKATYDQKLQERLSVGNKVYVLVDPQTYPNPALLVASLGANPSNPDRLYELTITPQMAKELKAEKLTLYNEEYAGEEEVGIPWTPACAHAPITQLCCSCWKPMIGNLRTRGYKDLTYPYICDNCGEVYGYKDLLEDTRDAVEGYVEEEPEEEE